MKIQNTKWISLTLSSVYFIIYSTILQNTKWGHIVSFNFNGRGGVLSIHLVLRFTFYNIYCTMMYYYIMYALGYYNIIIIITLCIAIRSELLHFMAIPLACHKIRIVKILYIHTNGAHTIWLINKYFPLSQFILWHEIVA